MRRLIGGITLFAALLLPAAADALPPKHKPVARAAVRAAPASSQPLVKPVSEGKGPSPGPNDVVLIAYIGKLVDGTVFDSNGQAALPVDGVVPGFGQALKQMKVGGSYHVTIPPALGYGDKAVGDIPANSTLIFDILLFDFKSKAEIEAMSKQLETPAPAPAKPAP